MKHLLCFFVLLAFLPLQAQLSYQVIKNHRVVKAQTLHMSTLPEGYAPALLREAPLPSRPSPKTSSPVVKDLENTSFRPGSTDVQPLVLNNFAAQGYQFSVPNDNHLAVGANGKMISVVNTNITGYDTLGNVLFSKSLSAFADTLGVLGYTFDPRVIYDPQADRFIVTFLNGYLDSTSQIILGFSDSPHPEGDWHFYLINGNPLNNSTWSDYPAMGISQQEVFLTFNTFTNGSTNNTGYTESTIWQIDKQKGFAGDNLISHYYYDITWAGDTLFNTTPVNGGTIPYGNNMYFLNTNPYSTGTDTLYLLEITNTIASGNAILQSEHINMGTLYYEPASAKQRLNHTLNTNDARVQSAILENNVLHLAFNTLDPVSQQAAVYYGRVQSFSGNRNAQAIIITDTLDFAYPAIAYCGDHAASESVIIGFLHSSSTTNAGQSAVYLDDQMNLSLVSRVKSGNGILNVLSGTYERWGDYTGISIQPGEPGSIWYSGSYSSTNARNMTWISKLRTGIPAVALQPEINMASELNLYPNPGSDRIQVKFKLENPQVLELSVFSSSGQKVKTILREWIRNGENEFSFSTDPLSTGTYFLQITDAGGEILGQHSFVISR